VFNTAAQLSRYASSMIGNAGFLKVDVAVKQHNNLAVRISTSRY